MDWVQITTALVLADMPSDLETMYDAWLTANPDKSGRLAEITASIRSEFRDALESHEGNILHEEEDYLPEACRRHLESIVYFTLAMEMGVDLSTAGNSARNSADVFLRSIPFGRFKATTDEAAAVSPSYSVPSASGGRSLPALLSFAAMILIGLMPANVGAGWIKADTTIYGGRVFPTYSPDNFDPTATDLNGYFEGVDLSLANIPVQASTSQVGIARFATPAEIAAGVSWTTIISPAGISSLNIESKYPSVYSTNSNLGFYYRRGGNAIDVPDDPEDVPTPRQAFILSGGRNAVSDEGNYYSVIVGGYTNLIENDAKYSIIGAGRSNRIWSDYSGLFSGSNNFMRGNFSFIGGGRNNHIADGQFNVISGGFGNTLSSADEAHGSFIGGGASNTTSAAGYSSIVGGFKNSMIQNSDDRNIFFSSILGGKANSLQPVAAQNYDISYALILNGFSNIVRQSGGIAAGFNVVVLHPNSFLINLDQGNTNTFVSQAAQEFAVRAGGGVRYSLGNTGTSHSDTTDSEFVITDLTGTELFSVSAAGPDLKDVFTIAPRSTEPGSPTANMVYLDDGSNTATGNPAFRRYTGAAWVDIMFSESDLSISHYPDSTNATAAAFTFNLNNGRFQEITVSENLTGFDFSNFPEAGSTSCRVRFTGLDTYSFVAPDPATLWGFEAAECTNDPVVLDFEIGPTYTNIWPVSGVGE